MTAHLPVFVIIISVPSSWNLAQRSFVSSLHLTSHIDVEHGGDVDVGESERTDVKALPSLGERRSSLNESLSESSTDGDTLSDARDIDCSPIIAAIEKADALVDSFRFGVNGLISVSLFSSAIMVKFSHFPINPNGS